MAASGVTVMNAPSVGSRAAMRASIVFVSSTLVVSPARKAAAASFTVIGVSTRYSFQRSDHMVMSAS